MHFLRLLLLLLWATSPSLHAIPEPTNPPQIDVTLISNVSQVKRGESVNLGIHFKLEKDWHIYWKDSGEAGFPTTVEWDIPKGILTSHLNWPRPHIFKELGDITTIGYKDETMLMAEMVIPKTWRENGPLRINAKVNWLACKTVCIPGSANPTISIPISDKTIFNESNQKVFAKFTEQLLTEETEQELIKEYEAKKLESTFISQIGTSPQRKALSLWMALLFAFLGGLILNLMPCVLPVLSIKALRFINHNKQTHKEMRKEILFFSLGILVSFLALASLVVGLKSIGHEIGWGFQFQEPRYLVMLAAIIFAFGLSLFGVFEFSLAVPIGLQKMMRTGSWLGPFSEGILATALATPCTAPLLGPALGFSFSQSPPVIYLFFTAIALGFATPYKLLALFPGWTRFLPKPGAWMETFKQLMGFPLVATAIWLLWILGRQAGHGAVIGALIFLFVVGLGLWVYQKRKNIFTAFLILLALMFSYVRFVEPTLQTKSAALEEEASSGIEWKPFSLDNLQESLELRDPVFVDFTADWCLTCQLNKKGVLSSHKIAQTFKEKGVVSYRADWTNRNDEITQVLKKLGRSGVPVYVFFLNGDAKNPIVLPELLTEKAILAVLN